MEENSNKRFAVLFNIWDENNYEYDKSEFDTLEETMEQVKLIKACYGDLPSPIEEKNKWGQKKVHYDNGAKYWGFLVLDYKEEKFVKSGGKGLKDIGKPTNKNLKMKDYFFTKPTEIPNYYVWDDGEYEGWLQYRFGDRKNAIAK